MNYENTRIAKLREYMFNIIDELSSSNEYQINANMLANDINNYSLDKVPVESEVMRWITGVEIHRDVYTFRSRVAYSQDVINNLNNIGFFERFEEKIKSNNDEGVLPEINGIQSIECLNCGTMSINDTDTAIFNIQIQIKYINKNDNNEISL